MKIVFLDSYSIAESSLEEVASLGELTCYDNTPTSELMIERARGAEVVITNKVKMFRAELEALRGDLKLICVAATGTNNIDLEAASELGIEVRNVPAYSTQSVTEATFAFVLALLRSLPFYNHYVATGAYSQSGKCFNLDMPISEILGKRWGIIGMGNIGQRVATIAEAFGAQVCYYSTSGRNGHQPYERFDLDELLATSDIVTIHAPLNPVTQNLIGERELALMGEGSILVNLGRGGIVDEAALAAALDNDTIGGAALDVFVNEPLEIESPLLNLRKPHKFIAAPHSGWSSREARSVLIATLAANIRGFFC